MKKLLNILKKLIYILDSLLSVIGKIIVASLIGLFILYLSFQNRMDDKRREENARVNFRGISFQFPMKVGNVLKAPISGFSRNHSQLQTDSIGGKNISAKWFFNWDYGRDRPELITDTVKQQLVYGVAFELRDDSCITNQEIVEEIQKIYPGNYRYLENYGNPTYIWERDCLTIFVKRASQYPAGYSVPEVSFCYGLDDDQKAIFGAYTGYIDNYPD